MFVHKLEHADLTGATLYTTLEPCLGCCIEQVVKRGIRRVVIGSMDPHPFVCARSLRRLHAASIPVDLFPMKYMVRINEQNSSFNTHRGKDPFDGRMSSG